MSSKSYFQVYYGELLNLIKVDYKRSAEHEIAMSKLELNLSRRIPISVKEWFLFSQSCKLLETYSNDDKCIFFNEELQAQSTTNENILLNFMLENQGVCYWSVSIDGDDPTVYVKYNEENYAWVSCSIPFSKFIYNWFYDNYGKVNPIYEAQYFTKTWSEESIKDLKNSGLNLVSYYLLPDWKTYKFYSGNTISSITVSTNHKYAEWNYRSEDKEAFLYYINEFNPEKLPKEEFQKRILFNERSLEIMSKR